MGRVNGLRVLTTALALLAAPFANAQTDSIKVGLVLPVSGPFTSTGAQILAGAKAYMKLHGDKVAGHTVDLIVRDDAGVADQTKRIAQELVVNDKVAVLAGFGLTPLAMAAAPIATQAQVPMVVMGAATSSVTERSPFVVRTSFAQGQSPYVMGLWSPAHGIRTAVTLVSDFAPGYDTEVSFKAAFEKAGGRVLESLRAPVTSVDFTSYLQRAVDAKPDAVFVFIPAGQAASFIKQFVERGLSKSGIKLIGAGDVTDDDVLNSMSSDIMGTVTAHPYSAAHKSPMNERFVAVMKSDSKLRPNFFAVAGYDGMQAIYAALEKTGGSSDGAAMMAAIKGSSWESPRGTITIDPATRDIIQDIYLRRVERVDGELYNVEFDKVAAVKDPFKAGEIPPAGK